MNLPANKLSRWYKEVLSGFTSPEVQRQLHRHDIEIKEHGEIKTVRVPILEIDNIGENMAVDEKMIGYEIYTILLNRNTNKIAMIAQTHRAKELVQILAPYHKITYQVKSITRDLSNTYDWFSRQIFPRAIQIADKFHIVKHIMDGMQDVRVRYRQELQRDKRVKYDEFSQKEVERKAECKEQGIVYRKQTFKYKDKYTKTGESYLELLARSRYLLFKFPSEWTESQKERSKVLFDLFPEIKYAYYLTLDFRKWYSKYNIGMNIDILQEELKAWYRDVKDFGVEEMLNIKSTIERNAVAILRYFENGATNAIAENLNSRIQRFYNINNGARDIDFFFFRIKNFFA